MAHMSDFVICTRDLEILFESMEITPVYPSTFWTSNPGKPPLTVNQSSPAESFHNFNLMIQGSRWVDVTVATFMTEVIKENPGIFSIVAPERWEADGREIVAAQGTVNPLSILQVTEVQHTGEVPLNLTGGTQAERLSKFYALLLLYRKTISRGVNVQHGMELSWRLNDFFMANGLNTQSKDILDLSGFVGENYMTPMYKKLVCAIDMFFIKYPTQKLARMRMATLPSRYRGCGAFTALGQISRVIGLSPKELLMFVFTEPVAKDVARISKSGEGMEDEFGYFPYHLEMGMTTKSAFSMSINPTLCFWLHTIGVVVGYKRSLNAKMLQVVDLRGTFESAAAVGLSFSSAEADQRAQDANMEDEEGHNDMEADPFQKILPTPAKDPLDSKVTNVLLGLTQHKGLTSEQKKTLTFKAARCRACREGTVGSYFNQFYRRI